MLELAARRCTRLNQDEAPLVRQLHLQDWYVEYELQVRMKASELPAVVKTELHGHIQDVFNEFGVQIMSPTSLPSRNRLCWWPGSSGIRRRPGRPIPPSPRQRVTTKAEARQQCRASCHEEKLMPQLSLASLSWEGLNFTRKARVMRAVLTRPMMVETFISRPKPMGALAR